MEDVNFGPDESMDDDEIGEGEDAEMDFGEDTGSEDTSRTDDDDEMDEEDDDEVDVDDETGESEGAWQDEEDDEADLVENGEEGEGDEDGDEDDEDEEVDDGVIWPEVRFPHMHMPSGRFSLAQGAEQVPGEADEGDDEEGIGGAFYSRCNFFCRAKPAGTGVPVILGEEEEEDEDEEWTSPQDGYVSSPEISLVLTLVLQRTGCA